MTAGREGRETSARARPDVERRWFDDDDETKSGGDDRGGDVENVRVTDGLGGDVSAGATGVGFRAGLSLSLSRRPEILRDVRV